MTISFVVVLNEFVLYFDMGCLCDKSKENGSEIVINKTYSWDQKKKLVNPQDFVFENLVNEERIKPPGSINGQQFIIQNCKDSTLYVLDHINTITIDDCFNCKVILGPVEGSTFIRNCTSCTFVVACGQFRMRDSNKINVFLFSATQPIIESSSGIRFGTYQLQYKTIQENFEDANLNFQGTNWKVIYDFTPVECEDNWNFMKNDKVIDYMSEPLSEEVKKKLRELQFSWCSPTETITETRVI